MAGERLSASKQEEAELDMTPMLDIVFIMLIFFIVTATFVKQAGIEVERPEAGTSIELKRVSILIGIGANDEVWIDNKATDIRDVRATVEKLRADNPQGSIVIQSDKRAKAGMLVKVMDAVREAGAPQVAVATEESK